MYGYVYKTTNKLNNKIYIGQNKGQFYSKYMGSGKYIVRALSKYGRGHFKVRLLVFTKSKKHTDVIEKQYIKYYRNLIGAKNMYNLADGGNGSSGCTHTKEAKQRIGRGYLVHRMDCNCFICKSRRGELSGKNNLFYGKKHTEDSKNKMRNHSWNKGLTKETDKRVARNGKNISKAFERRY
jgi:group I intron endonuclease